jgi:hemoglobin
MTMKLKSLRAIAALLVLASLAPAHAADDATYRGLGGQQGIKNIVTTFIPLILADARIKESFADSDMKHVAMRLEEQFCMLSGGPCAYQGKDMTEIQEGLNISNAQFNALAEDLQVAMERNGVPSHVQNKLVAKLAPMQRAIVTR